MCIFSLKSVGGEPKTNSINKRAWETSIGDMPAMTIS